jgi:3-mercaptopyruvate sulfurtransferase SseA
MLHKLGVTRVRPLSGGMDAWRAAGYPLEYPSPT